MIAQRTLQPIVVAIAIVALTFVAPTFGQGSSNAPLRNTLEAMAANDTTSPKILFEFRTLTDDSSVLRSLAASFAAEEGLQIDDSSDEWAALQERPVVNVYLWRGEDVMIGILSHPRVTNRFSVAIYEPIQNASFDGIANRFVERLRAEWPDAASDLKS